MSGGGGYPPGITGKRILRFYSTPDFRITGDSANLRRNWSIKHNPTEELIYYGSHPVMRTASGYSDKFMVFCRKFKVGSSLFCCFEWVNTIKMLENVKNEGINPKLRFQISLRMHTLMKQQALIGLTCNDIGPYWVHSLLLWGLSIILSKSWLKLSLLTSMVKWNIWFHSQTVFWFQIMSIFLLKHGKNT